LRAALADTDDPLSAFHPPDGADPKLVAMQRQFLIAQITEHKAKIAALDGQRAQKEAELATIAATIDKLEAVIPTIQERVNIRKSLNEYGSRLQYFEVLQQLTESQQERLVQKSHLREAQAAVAAITETRGQTAAEYRRTLFGELAEAERKAAGFAADLSKAQERTKLQLLTAPVAGMVQQLAVHTVGGVVTPAQTLMVIVPSDSELEIEAMVSNHDIGFVHAGDAVEIKVDTFDFTRYGLLHGKVLSISQDSITRDISNEKAGDRPPGTATSEPKGQELSYATRRGSRSTTPRCRSMTRWSIFHPVWRSPPKSRPAHARPYHRLKHLAEQVAVTEPAMAIDRECRVVRDPVVQIEAAEPAIG